MQQFDKVLKMVIIAVFCLLGVNKGHGQNLPLRYATLELFTNTPCPICGSQNPGFFNRLNAYEGKYHLISFYPGTPYSSCIFYQANTQQNIARKNYYQIVGTPTVAINGTQFKSAGQVTNAVLDAVTGGESWLEVQVDETAANTRTVDINLVDHVGGSITSGRLFAVIVEKLIMYNAPNGETLHRNVFRKFLTEVSGEDVDMSSGTASKTYQYTVDPSWQADQVYVIAWLINPATKEIYNSGTRFDINVTGTSDFANAKMDLMPFPNPASNLVSISLQGVVDEKVNVKVFSPEGRLVKSFNNQPVTSASIELSVQDLSSGLYYLLIETKDGSHAGKIVVE